MNSIDSTGAELFVELFDILRKLGVTVLLIHHDLKQVKQVSDEVTCINKGLIFSGKPEDVMDEKHIFEIFSTAPGKREN
jgi:zinc transport system ATP-binding protein